MVSEILLLVILSVASLSEASSAGPGQPLFLSQYLPGNPGLAKKLSFVQVPGYSYPSYSGFLTVNQSAGSNSFFWFFPAETMSQSAPVLLWLQGGPGASSLYGLFSENGPFTVSADGNSLVSNPYRWTKRFSMLYIDNPVGAGFSFTQSANGFSRNEHEVGENLYSALSQFFQVFSDLRNNEFYITGESYGGKYVPSTAYTIHHKNQNPNNVKINLKGIAVGDGLMDPITQLTDFANQAYYFSIADHNERQVIAEYDRKIKENLQNDKPIEAFRLFDEMMNGDFYPYPTYFENITGSSNYFNFLTPIYPPNPYDTYLNLTSTRLNIHVGDVAYWDYNASVELHLKHDWMVSVKHKVEFLLDQQYKVLIYNGQADVILGAPLCENLMQKLKWVGEKEYKKSKKFIWKVAKTDQIVAGFVRHALNLVQIVVRDAGHMVPLDQPRAAYDMISRFIDGKTFKF